MLTRIRIEAEGATTSEVQEDIFATYDALVAATYGFPNGTSQGPFAASLPCRLTGEVYEQMATEEWPAEPRRYKGRAIAYFPIDDDHAVGAEQIRAFDRSKPQVTATHSGIPPTSS